MSPLPSIIQRIPGIFYGLAALFFVASIALTLVEVAANFGHAEATNPMARMTALRGLFQALLEATYIAAIGVIAHILLAIWRNGSAQPLRGGNE